MHTRSNALCQLSAIGLAIASACGVHAQTRNDIAQSAAQTLQQVVVATNGGDEERRLSTTAKIIIDSETLHRFNDASATDALRRVPGITISGSGQAREIRMRGMGNGYTQLLLNGEPVSADFGLDSLSPDLIERIEIQRSATADSSAQAIAGSINIVLKRKIKPGQSSIKSSLSAMDGRPSGKLSFQYGNQADQLSYGLVGMLGFDNENLSEAILLQASKPDGSPLYGRLNSTIQLQKRTSLGISPNANWKFGDDTSLNINGTLQAIRNGFDGEDHQSILFGSRPTFKSDALGIKDDTIVARLGAELKSEMDGGGKLFIKGGAFHSRKTTNQTLDANDWSDSPILFRAVQSLAQESRTLLTGKYSHALGETHDIAVGWDGSIVRRSEERKQHETSNTGYPTVNQDELHEANVSRLAVFVQDEWALSKTLSAYAGIRWEGLATDVTGTGIHSVRNESSVWSPVMQILWKLPNTKADQLRIALAKTYKSPTARELIPRRWIETDNTATTPNFQGNPNLVPELSVGLDVGYEHYLPAGGLVGINAYSRNISNVVLQQVFQQNGLWIATPVNVGDATAMGIEFESKFKLNSILSEAPDIELRTGATRNISEIKMLSSSSNRISGQPPFTATLGADYRPAGSNLTIGMGYVFAEQAESQSSQAQWLLSPVKRTLDLYSRWQLDKRTKLQVTLSNALHQSTDERHWYRDSNFVQSQSTMAPGFTTLRLSLEMPLK